MAMLKDVLPLLVSPEGTPLTGEHALDLSDQASIVYRGVLKTVPTLTSFRGIGSIRSDVIRIELIVTREHLLLTRSVGAILESKEAGHREDTSFVDELKERLGQDIINDYLVLLVPPLRLKEASIAHIFYDDNNEFSLEFPEMVQGKNGMGDVAPAPYVFRADSETSKKAWMNVLHSVITKLQQPHSTSPLSIQDTPSQAELLQDRKVVHEARRSSFADGSGSGLRRSSIRRSFGKNNGLQSVDDSLEEEDTSVFVHVESETGQNEVVKVQLRKKPVALQRNKSFKTLVEDDAKSKQAPVLRRFASQLRRHNRHQQLKDHSTSSPTITLSSPKSASGRRPLSSSEALAARWEKALEQTKRRSHGSHLDSAERVALARAYGRSRSFFLDQERSASNEGSPLASPRQSRLIRPGSTGSQSRIPLLTGKTSSRMSLSPNFISRSSSRLGRRAHSANATPNRDGSEEDDLEGLTEEEIKRRELVLQLRRASYDIPVTRGHVESLVKQLADTVEDFDVLKQVKADHIQASRQRRSSSHSDVLAWDYTDAIGNVDDDSVDVSPPRRGIAVAKLRQAPAVRRVTKIDRLVNRLSGMYDSTCDDDEWQDVVEDDDEEETSSDASASDSDVYEEAGQYICVEETDDDASIGNNQDGEDSAVEDDDAIYASADNLQGLSLLRDSSGHEYDGIVVTPKAPEEMLKRSSSMRTADAMTMSASQTLNTSVTVPKPSVEKESHAAMHQRLVASRQWKKMRSKQNLFDQQDMFGDIPSGQTLGQFISHNWQLLMCPDVDENEGATDTNEHRKDSTQLFDLAQGVDAEQLLKSNVLKTLRQRQQTWQAHKKPVPSKSKHFPSTSASSERQRWTGNLNIDVYGVGYRLNPEHNSRATADEVEALRARKRSQAKLVKGGDSYRTSTQQIIGQINAPMDDTYASIDECLFETDVDAVACRQHVLQAVCEGKASVLADVKAEKLPAKLQQKVRRGLGPDSSLNQMDRFTMHAAALTLDFLKECDETTGL